MYSTGEYTSPIEHSIVIVTSGYGDSSGHPTSEQAVVSDALSVYRWIVRCHRDNVGVPVGASESGPEFGPETVSGSEMSRGRIEDGATSETAATSAGAPVIVWGHSLGTGYILVYSTYVSSMASPF